VAEVIDIAAGLKGRIHHDAVIHADVLQEVAVAHDLLVSFGRQHAPQREIPFDRRQRHVWTFAADGIEDVALATAWLQDAVSRLDTSKCEESLDHRPRRREESRQVFAAELVFGARYRIIGDRGRQVWRQLA